MPYDGAGSEWSEDDVSPTPAESASERRRVDDAAWGSLEAKWRERDRAAVNGSAPADTAPASEGTFGDGTTVPIEHSTHPHGDIGSEEIGRPQPQASEYPSEVDLLLERPASRSAVRQEL